MFYKISVVIILFFILGLYTSIAPAQNTQKNNINNRTNNNTDKPKQIQIPKNITVLLNQARSVPPEFYADAIIRIVDSRKIHDPKINIELLKEAFEQANQAQLKTKKTVFRSINIDTRIGYLDKAYDLNLDMISLNCRVINTLLELDKNTAKEYFSKISLTPLIKQPLSCKDIAIYDITTYYETTTKIAEQCFTNKEIEQGDRTRFIEEKINNIVSPIELTHIAKLITTFNWNPLDTEILLSAYSNKVQHLTDYRSFIASESIYRTTESIYNLATYCDKKQIPSKYLVQAYKDYIINNLSQKICPDISEREKLIPQLISRANSRLFRENPIVLAEIKLQQEEVLAEDPPFFSSSKSKLILDEMRKLYTNLQKGDTINSTDKDTNLEESYSKFLGLFRSWKTSDEPTEEDYLHQKAIIYQELIELTQTEKQKDELLSEYLLFLRDFKLDNISRAEWFVHLNFMLKMTKLPNQESKTKIITLLQNSQNAVAQLYTALILENL